MKRIAIVILAMCAALPARAELKVSDVVGMGSMGQETKHAARFYLMGLREAYWMMWMADLKDNVAWTGQEEPLPPAAVTALYWTFHECADLNTEALLPRFKALDKQGKGSTPAMHAMMTLTNTDCSNWQTTFFQKNESGTG